ncbi:MBL fold metallo-hydrolase [Clostridium cellulovorans]|uniref:Zinc-dependent hydrolase n=1 Tax=Clostridium cellulovorans (strain ATCC 35296 / DSM 3052 / OCM 3 / 743B) TaxID=573061 RepID=D9SQ60_CLOC7|nr:MBL fold metallo-hydrolase [Clostridium cellulovorans]ADL50127.1 zinc-dependent hydrolase [Clostridium cellulovorans 743B]
MKIYFLGESSFILESNNHSRILIDPYNDFYHKELYNLPFDVVTISHHHPNHSYLKNLINKPLVIDTADYHATKDFLIKGIISYHDNVKGARRGKNIIFTYESDGYRLCHLGDLGHELSLEFLDFIGDVDVLMIPTGGNFTIGPTEAHNLCIALKPKVIFPMAYKTDSISYPLEGLDPFISKMKNGEKLLTNYFEITSPLTSLNRVIILNYSV